MKSGKVKELSVPRKRVRRKVELVVGDAVTMDHKKFVVIERLFGGFILEEV